MKNEIKIHWLVFHAMWVIILLLFLIAFFGIKDANSCLESPLIYGAQKATNDVTGSMFCQCTFSNPSYQPLYFNHENMSTNPEELYSQIP